MTVAERQSAANLRGILWMAAGSAVVSVMHVGVRAVSAEIDPAQIALVRNVVGLLALGPLLLRQDRGAWVSRRPGLMALRGAVGATAMLTWFYGLSYMPAGDATALSFTVAIFATIAAAVLLKERVGPRRWAAVGIGFVGAMIIVRPGFQEFSLGTALVLVSTVMWALALVMVKMLARVDSTITIVFYANFYFLLFTAIPGVISWQWPTPSQWGALVVIGLMAQVGHTMLAQAMRAAEAAAVMPVDFTRLIWASAVGYIVFGEFPDSWTWAGGALIFAATLYIGYRESRPRTDG